MGNQIHKAEGQDGTDCEADGENEEAKKIEMPDGLGTGGVELAEAVKVEESEKPKDYNDVLDEPPPPTLRTEQWDQKPKAPRGRKGKGRGKGTGGRQGRGRGKGKGRGRSKTNLKEDLPIDVAESEEEGAEVKVPEEPIKTQAPKKRARAKAKAKAKAKQVRGGGSSAVVESPDCPKKDGKKTIQFIQFQQLSTLLPFSDLYRSCGCCDISRR